MGKYAIYLRKSRADIEAESNGEGETFARHEFLLQETAKKLGLCIDKIYREIVSGETIQARPIMQQLLKDVEAKMWDGVLVMEVERLARGDTVDQGLVARAFQYSFTSIITPTKTYRPWEEFDEEYFEFGLFMSRREYKTILRRMQNGRAASAHEGKYCGSVPPYGYCRVKLPHEKGFTLQIVPDQAEMIRFIFQWAAFGVEENGTNIRLGASKIAQRLTAMQIPTPSGKSVWSASSILDILHNPVYCGKIRWGSRAQIKSVSNGQMIHHRPRKKLSETQLIMGRHPPIISADVWELAQKGISPHLLVPSHTDCCLKNPFAGLLVCADCGHCLTRRPGRMKNGICQPDLLICTTAGCHNIGSRMDFIEQAVLHTLYNWLGESNFSLPTVAAPNTSEQELALLKNSKERLLQQAQTIYSLLENGIYSPDIFRERIQKNKAEILQADARIEALQESCTSSSCQEISSQITAKRMLSVYSQSSAEEKNQLLKLLFSKIEYRKTVRGQGHETEFNLTLFPLLPPSDNL